MDRHCPCSSKHFLLAAAVILCMAIPSCKAQDAVEIVAKAVLCFDNHTVINKCLQQIGIGSNARASTQGAGAGGHGHRGGAVLDASANASAALCDTPCFEHMLMMTDCMDDILSNFQGYSAGLIKGYRAVFEMSCRVVTAGAAGGSSSSTANATVAGGGDADDRHSPSHGAAKGSLVSGSAVANGAGGRRFRVGNLVWAAILAVTVRHT
uniref:Pectinesterase inhibitor domain-containing protein n=1 Tax=Oryza punctata TaxID=4537 RepID=A0A0E0KCP9_ORYPU